MRAKIIESLNFSKSVKHNNYVIEIYCLNAFIIIPTNLILNI